jgi:hypothetical protein
MYFKLWALVLLGLIGGFAAYHDFNLEMTLPLIPATLAALVAVAGRG